MCVQAQHSLNKDSVSKFLLTMKLDTEADCTIHSLLVIPLEANEFVLAAE